MVNLPVWYALSLGIDRLIYKVVVKSREKHDVYSNALTLISFFRYLNRFKEKHDTLACKQHIYSDPYVQRN